MDEITLLLRKDMDVNEHELERLSNIRFIHVHKLNRTFIGGMYVLHSLLKLTYFSEIFFYGLWVMGVIL